MLLATILKHTEYMKIKWLEKMCLYGFKIVAGPKIFKGFL